MALKARAQAIKENAARKGQLGGVVSNIFTGYIGYRGSTKPQNIYFTPQVYMMGSIVISPISYSPSLNISEGAL